MKIEAVLNVHRIHEDENTKWLNLLAPSVSRLVKSSRHQISTSILPADVDSVAKGFDSVLKELVAIRLSKAQLISLTR